MFDEGSDLTRLLCVMLLFLNSMQCNLGLERILYSHVFSDSSAVSSRDVLSRTVPLIVMIDDDVKVCYFLTMPQLMFFVVRSDAIFSCDLTRRHIVQCNALYLSCDVMCVLLHVQVDDKTIVMVVDKGDADSKAGGGKKNKK